MTFDDVLSPVDTATFLERYLSQEHLLVRGEPGRFQSLVSWEQLNEALSRVRVNEGRVRVLRQGRDIPKSDYVYTSPNSGAQYLIGPGLIKQLTAGGTLLVTQVDELLQPLRNLCETCEAVLRVYIAANLYAAWKTDHAFDMHWDTHDTLILQVYGRKAWTVWAPTRQHPLREEHNNLTLTPRPSAAPVWEGYLEDGQAFYMPRGWWHLARPTNEPTVHVTLGIQHRTGIDLLKWAVQRMAASEQARMDVPHWRSTADISEWTRNVRDQLAGILADDVVQTYLAEQEASAHTRPIVQLPKTFEERLAIDADMGLRLVKGCRLHLQSDKESGTVSFTANGSAWRCSDTLRPALALLTHNVATTLTAMNDVIDGRHKQTLKAFLTLLLRADVIWAENRPEVPVARESLSVRQRALI